MRNYQGRGKRYRYLITLTETLIILHIAKNYIHLQQLGNLLRMRQISIET